MSRYSYSFVVPAYNDAKGLQRHFEYFSTRSELIQLVIVDDCSEDDTQRLVDAAELPENVRISYHRQIRNCGPAAARNKGLELTDGDYVMFLDADDLLADCFFDYIRLSPLMNNADFVLFKYHLAHDDGQRYSYNMHRVDNAFFSGIGDSGFPTRTFTVAELPAALNTVNFPWNKIYRGDFIRNANIRFPELRMHEDILPHWHSFLRARRFGVLAWAPSLITHYETSDGGRATNYVGEQRLGVFPMLLELHEELYGHKFRDLLLPEFDAFCSHLFDWMTNALCAGNSDEKKLWRARYREEIDRFRARVEAVSQSDEEKTLLPFWGQ